MNKCNNMVICDQWSHMTPSGGLEVIGANSGGGLNLGWELVDRQAAYQRTKK